MTVPHSFLPNFLSALRLALAPYVFYLMWVREYRAVLVWFAIAGLTDAADGFAARKLKAASPLGAYLDPIADKVLLSGAFLVLALSHTIPLWLAILVLGRDAAILLFAAGVMLFTRTQRSFPPSGWGKVCTVVQICFVVAAVANQAGYLTVVFVRVLAGITATLTAWSAVDYAWRQFVGRP